MQRLQFQGYAQRKNNLGWQIPDNLRAMQDETERTLRGMREYQKQLNKNKEEYLDGMKENARLQEVNIKRNQTLDEEFSAAYQEAELQHYEQRLADVKPGGGLYQDSQNKQKRLIAKEKQWQDLVKMVPSMVKNAAFLNNQHMEKMQAIGVEVATRWNLSAIELAALKNGDRQVDWVHKAITRVEHRLKEGGASAAEQKAVFGLSGRKMLGAQIYAVSNMGGRLYERHIIDNINTPFKGLGTLSDHLNGAEGTSDESFRTIKRKIRESYLLKLKDKEGNLIYDMKFLRAHLTPGLDKIDDLQWAEQLGRTNDAHQEDKLKESTIALKAYMKGYGGADRHLALPRWIDVESAKEGAPSRAQVRDRAFVLLAQMASTGELTRTEFADMMNGDVVLGEPGKGGQPQRQGSIWSDQAQQVYKALDDRDKRFNQQRETQKKAFDNQMKGEMANAALSMGRNLNKWEIDKVEDLYLQNNYQVPQWLEKYKNAEEMSKEESKYELDKRINTGGGLTMMELYSGRYDSSVLKGYEQHTVNGPGAISDDAKREYVGSVKSAVAQAVNSVIVDTGVRKSQTRIMSGRAITILNNRVREATIAGIYSTSTDAWVQESNKLRKEIESGEGIFAPKKDAGGNVLVGKEGGFQYLEDALQFDRVGVEYRKKASEDKKFIYTPGSISQKELQAIADVPSGTPIPGFIYQLDQVYPHKDPYDIMNTLLEANGAKPLERPGLAKVREFVHPTVAELITRKGTSQARTARAVEATMKLTDQENEAISPMLQMLKSKAVMTIDPENEGYDAISTSRGFATSTSQYNKPLMEMTVGEVDALQRRDGIQLGAYQIDAKTLQYYINKGWINKDDMFDSLLQNRLGRWQRERTSGLFQTPGGDDIPGLGQDTLGWKPVKDIEKEDAIKVALAGIAAFDSFKFKDNLFSGVA